MASYDSYTLLPTPPLSNRELPIIRRKPDTQPHCYHQIGMKPQSIGRAVGIGLRVAGRIAGQRVAASVQAAASQPTPIVQAPDAAARAAQTRASGKVAGQATRGVARGVGGFLRPFQRVGGIIWLEVAGVFFFLPVVVFGPTVWKTRLSWAHGPDHRTFLIAAGIVLLFLYLSVTSFLRARRR